MEKIYENNRYEKWAVLNRIIGKYLSTLGLSLVMRDENYGVSTHHSKTLLGVRARAIGR